MAPPVSRQKALKGASSASSSTTQDPRFARFQSDPRFRLPSRKQNTVKLDKRFANILKDDEFSRKASVDRYGRKVGKEQGRKELERLYRLDDSEEEAESGEEDEIVRKELRRADRSYDPAREGGFSDSSSSEEESSDEELEVEVEEDIEEAELYPAEQGAEVPMGEVSRRLAVVNLDWDNIGASDLMAVAASFAPRENSIRRVTVYPSEFGRERMQREEMEGPPAELFAKSRTIQLEESDDEEDSDDEEERIKKELLKEDKGDDFDASALRQYQLDRLRYYYAVIECSSEDVAQALYEAMDGREYLSSANFFDLRFIPDETSFEDDKPRDTCNAVPTDYRPSEFVTDALTHSKVKLTWDADDTKRKEVQKRAFSRKEIDENDLQAYIGSASSSEDEEEEEEEEEMINPMTGEAIETASVVSRATTRADRRDALRAALGLPPEPEKGKKKKDRRGSDAAVGDMQISFTPGLTAAAPKKGAVFANKPDEETTREKYIRKEKERKQKKKERVMAIREGRDPDQVSDGDATEQQEPTVANDEDDDPFNDPFFTDPVAAQAEAKKVRAATKKRERLEKEAAEASTKARERAELELLMDDGDKNVRHFNMKDIQRAEKLSNKKVKDKKSVAKKKAAIENAGGDGFEMDVADPRFAKLFENHEFAIDPTNPRYKGTEGMKKLLQEGRKKRDAVVGGGPAKGVTTSASSSSNKKRAREDNDVITTTGIDVMGLVDKMKKRAKT